MPRKPLIAGNWKMHTNLAASRDLAATIAGGLAELGASATESFDAAFFPPATSLAAVVEAVRGSSSPDVIVGAQNMHFEKSGAFTGEISAEMILGCGASAVILGHSERRHVFGESDEWIGKKVGAALEAGLTPILCVGETLDERDAEQTMSVVARQLAAGIEGIHDVAGVARVVVAYEPVWAIGTGRTATPEQAQEVHGFLRSEIAAAFAARGAAAEGRAEANALRILYGGSVKAENARGLLDQPDIDGALVGGASLKANSFIGICRGCLPAA